MVDELMYLSIDYGKKRIGLAIGQLIPSGAGVLDAEDKEVVAKIKKTIQENEVEGVIIGMPLRSQGEEGTIAAEIHKFADELAESTKLPIYFENEQYTSAEAESFLRDNDLKMSRKGGEIDEMAAILILEQFLARRKENPAITPDIDPR